MLRLQVLQLLLLLLIEDLQLVEDNEDLLASIRRQALQIFKRAHVDDEPCARRLKIVALTVDKLELEKIISFRYTRRNRRHTMLNTPETNLMSLVEAMNILSYLSISARFRPTL